MSAVSFRWQSIERRWRNLTARLRPPHPLLLRAGSLAAATLAASAVLVVDAVGERPIVEGQRSPRTVVAGERIQTVDEPATVQAKADAAAEVDSLLRSDPDARAAITRSVERPFDAAVEAREADEDGDVADRDVQFEQVSQAAPMLSPAGVALLVDASDRQLTAWAGELRGVALSLARRTITDEQVESALTDALDTEVPARALPDDVVNLLAEPLLADAIRPTVTVDVDATEQAREAAADEVDAVLRTWSTGQTVVSAGETVDPVVYEALRERGLTGTPVGWAALRALAAAVAAALVFSAVAVRDPQLWQRRRVWTVAVGAWSLLLLLLASATTLLPSVWLLAVPLFAPVLVVVLLYGATAAWAVGLAAAVWLAFSGATLLPLAVAAATAVAVPAAGPRCPPQRVRRSLAAAAARSATAAAAVALLGVGGLWQAESAQVLAASAVGATLAWAAAVAVLPWVEGRAGVLTYGLLSSLADRNHPLLRRLEDEALGSYNHSVTVASLARQAAEAAGGDGTLASVQGLYHDIGKVAAPQFFSENQMGGGNPHDRLAPRVSAKIIHAHVADGVEIAGTYRLPPEIVDGIATHHGTTRVEAFARRQADLDATVDLDVFRYPGRRPDTVETAVLMLADCSEAAVRAAAARGQLDRAGIADVVDGLLADRAADHQLDLVGWSPAQRARARDALVDALTGIYHPRVAYPPAAKDAVDAPVGP